MGDRECTLNNKTWGGSIWGYNCKPHCPRQFDRDHVTREWKLACVGRGRCPLKRSIRSHLLLVLFYSHLSVRKWLGRVVYLFARCAGVRLCSWATLQLRSFPRRHQIAPEVALSDS
jgi:hypothetical protein